MLKQNLVRLSRYGLIIGAVALTLALQLILNQYVATNSIFLLYFGSVLVGACYEGVAGGITATILSIFIVSMQLYLQGNLTIVLPVNYFFGSFLFAIYSLIITLIISRLQAEKCPPLTQENQLIQNDKNLSRVVENASAGITGNECNWEQFVFATQNQILASIAKGIWIPEMLEKLSLSIEDLSYKTCCCVLLLDHTGTTLYPAAAPTLPEEFRLQLAKGIPVTPERNNCAAAVYYRQPITVSNLDCEQFFGCWAAPIVTSKGSVLGAFVMYSQTPRQASDKDWKLMEIATNLLGIALEKTLAEQSLQQSEQRFRTTFKNSPIILFHQDKELCYTSVYNSLLPLNNKKSIFGQTDWEIFNAEDAEKLINLKRRVLQSGTGRRQEISLTFNSQVFHFDLTVEPVRNMIGEVVGLAGAFTNITDLKETQAALKQANEELERRVEDRTNQLLLLNRKLRCQLLKLERTKKKLQEIKQLQEAILNSANYTIITTDTSGTILTFNATAEKLLGWSAREIIGKTTPIIFHDSTEINHYARELSQKLGITVLPGFEVFVLKALQGNVDEREWSYIRKDGSRFSVLLSVTALRDIKGNITGFVGIGRDITERQIAQQALQESEERFRLLAENSTDMISRHAPNGSYLYVSPACQTLLGYTPGELIGRSPYEFFHPEDVAYIEAQHSHVLQNSDNYCLVYRFRRKDGSYIWFETNCRSIFDNQTGQVLEIQCASRDITERKQIEEALRESERKFRAIFDHTFEFISLMQPDGKLLEMNQAQLDFLGLSYEQAIGLMLWELPCWNVSPQVQNDVKSAISLASEGQFVRYEVTLCDDNIGTLFTFDFSIKPVFDDHGKVVLLIPEGRDLTARKRAEESMRREKEFSQRLIASSFDGIMAFDRNLCYTLWNSGMERISGIKRDNILGKYALDSFPFFREIGEDKMFEAALGGEAIIAKNRPFTIPETGKSGFFEACYSPLKDEKGEIMGGLAIVRDITDRKQSQEEIQQQSQIIEHIRGAVILTDLENKIISWNQGAEKLYGYQAQEVLGQPIYFLVFPREEEFYHEMVFQPVMAQGEYQIETKVRKKSGEQIDAMVFLSLLKNTSGAVTGIISYTLDITDRKRIEEKIRLSLQEKEVLIKEIHHRVKNNLQIVSGLLYLQSRYIKDGQVVQILQETRERIQAMAMIHEKLYCSETFTEIDLNDYISNLTRNLFLSYTVNTEIRLNVNIEPILIDIDTAIPCGLIINELVCNSLKYAFPNDSAGEIAIDFYRTDEEKFVLWVRDNGIGLPESFTLANSNSLGLRLVHSLATKQLGGTLELIKGQGAIFKITLNG